jgi:hypothetical protein
MPGGLKQGCLCGKTGPAAWVLRSTHTLAATDLEIVRLRLIGSVRQNHFPMNQSLNHETVRRFSLTCRIFDLVQQTVHLTAVGTLVAPATS